MGKTISSMLIWQVSIALLTYYVLCDFSTWYGICRTVLSFALLQLVFATSLCVAKMRPPPQDDLDFTGKRVVITGGNSGIGYSLAKQVLTSGASHVVLVARNKERLTTCVEELNTMKESGAQQVSFISVDLSKDAQVVQEKVDELCAGQLGGGNVDVLINCAGYSIPGEFTELAAHSFAGMMDANYFSSVNITRAVVPHMVAQSFGQIVFVSSVAGQLGLYGFSAYSPSKYAIRGFSEVLYHELRPYGIGVSLVFPPDTETPGFEKEELLKPTVTKRISEQAGLWKSDVVAELILSNLRQRKYLIGCGSDGFFINALTCGGAPPHSTVELWVQCLLMPILRIYMLFMNTFFTHLIDEDHKGKVKQD